jgi:hypothetical protein
MHEIRYFTAMAVLSKAVNVAFVNEQPALESAVHASILSLSRPHDTLVFEKERLIEAGPYLRISQPPFSRSQGCSKLLLVTGCELLSQGPPFQLTIGIYRIVKDTK